MKIAATDPPELSIWGIAGGFGVGTNHLGQFDRGDFTIRENVTINKGGHELHFGGEAVRISNHIVNTFLQNGYFEFDGRFTGEGLADFVLGRASGFGQGGGEYKLLKGTKWGFYAQDNWRVSARLSLNFGLRWDPCFSRSMTVKAGLLASSPVSNPSGTRTRPWGLPTAVKTTMSDVPSAGLTRTWGNSAPRIGFAYRLNESGRTSLRGGVGSTTPRPQQTSSTHSRTSLLFAPGFFFNNVSFDDPFGSAGVPNPFPEQYGPRVPGPDATFITPTTIRAGQLSA